MTYDPVEKPKDPNEEKLARLWEELFSREVIEGARLIVEELFERMEKEEESIRE